MKRLRGNLTYANVTATLALFLVVAGGTTYAASQLGKESVGSRELEKGAVTPIKLSKASRAALVGPEGPGGAKGERGPNGAAGVPGPQGGAGPSAAYAMYHNAAIQVPNDLEVHRVATLSVPAGSYVVSAKLNTIGEGGVVSCRLAGPGASDEAEAEPGSQLTTEIVHVFGAGGGAYTLDCDSFLNSGSQVFWIKMIATKVGTIAANTPG
jgi:hypothetical protein